MSDEDYGFQVYTINPIEHGKLAELSTLDPYNVAEDAEKLKTYGVVFFRGSAHANKLAGIPVELPHTLYYSLVYVRDIGIETPVVNERRNVLEANAYRITFNTKPEGTDVEEGIAAS